ncbi:hypothetical protein X772_21995 [Mesorhizobium sp. LSJC280B00]|nr:hypothetical protein X772_21995 [Mesorhizobium sp. LSJC280B00]
MAICDQARRVVKGVREHPCLFRFVSPSNFDENIMQNYEDCIVGNGLRIAQFKQLSCKGHTFPA